MTQSPVRDGITGARVADELREAILRGVDALEPGDALLICGKGHETGQIVGETVFPFDDAEQASVAVAAGVGAGAAAPSAVATGRAAGSCPPITRSNWRTRR